MLDIIDNYIGGTIEELLTIYKQYAEIETNKAYCPPPWVIKEYY